MLDGGFEDFDDEEVSMRSVGDALDMLAEAIRHGDEHAMESALRALRKDLESQLDAAEEHARNEKDPSKRDLLQAAIDNLRNKLNGMLDKVVRNAIK
jgi:antirestriction protein